MEEIIKKEKKIKKIKKINKKKLTITIILILIILSAVTVFIVYCKNSKFREWADIKILRKEIHQGKTVSVEISTENNSNIYAFDKYLVALENKVLKIYNNIGTEEASITTDINNPIFDSAGKYLIIAENSGESIYVLEGKKVLWSTTIEGKITQIQINENGYAGVVVSDISYKNIINIYNLEGKTLLKTYVANNKVVDISISKNNQYLAIAEIDMSGVLIKSNIKIIDIEKAKKDASNSVVNTYSAEVGKLITNIEYQNKERLLCIYNDSINIIEENNNKLLIKLNANKTTFASIELKNNIVTVDELNKEDYSSSSSVNITNITNNKIKKYEIDEIAKEIYTFEDVIALNFGTELHIINTNGWLMKKYVSEQEINKIVLSNKLAGIIYRDRIEIVDF